MEYTVEDFIITIKFIKAYRNMEQRSIATNKKIIKKVVTANHVKHLSNSWESRNNDFGSFYLNLSHENQISFISHFGIKIPDGIEYLVKIKSHPAAYIYTTPPAVATLMNQLLLFFNNNGISEDAIPGIKMYFIPEDRYGNSANWGKYILNLSMPHQLTILKQIALNSVPNIQLDEQNRTFFRQKFLINRS